MPSNPQPSDYLSLGQAAQLTPGRPSSNVIWRWCRRGVLARTGKRVRLEHVRLGGRVYTTATWLDRFGRALAEADAAYFDLADDDRREPRRSRTGRSRREDGRGRHDKVAEAERHLDEAGI